MSTRNESDEQKYDEVFVQIAGQIGSIQGLLDYFFGFMHRKTDFYVQYADAMQEASMGFPIGAAERMVTKCFRKYKMKDYASLSTVPINETVISISEATRVPSTPAFISLAKTQINRTDANSKSQQIPVGNGGVADNYYWTQTLNEVTVYVDAPTACRGKDVKCNMTHKTIHLAVNGKTLLEGEFEEGVRVDESMWTLNIDSRSDAAIGRSEIVITIEKGIKTWWKHVIIGHPEIDTTKVDSTRRIDEYDEGTQAALRKAMFDQRQKAAGVVTCGDIESQNVLNIAQNIPGAPKK